MIVARQISRCKKKSYFAGTCVITNYIIIINIKIEEAQSVVIIAYYYRYCALLVAKPQGIFNGLKK